MYQIAYIGRWETLPETAAAICDHDTSKLEALLQGGLDLDVPIQLSEYIKLMPLEIAVFRNDVPMIHFLLEHGADSSLAEEQPLLLTAARCCGPEVVALFAGQAAKLSSKQKERAFQEVRWGKRPENIQVLEQAGITVEKFGGEAFRAAVSEGNTKLARLLLEKGQTSIITSRTWCSLTPPPLSPRPPAPTISLWCAGSWNRGPTSPLLTNTATGLTPWRCRTKSRAGRLPESSGAGGMAQRAGKDPAAHALQAARQAGGILEDRPPTAGVPGSKWVKWAELYSFMDVQEMTWKRKKLLSLMVQMDNYSDYLLLWSPRDKKLWYLDIEHEEFHPLAKWDDFIADPGRYLNGMIEGEFEE